MDEVLEALNTIVADGVIETYAIGGAIGASFYIDALQTEDVDAFVFLPTSAAGLVLLTPIYEALQKLGGKVEREYVRFGDWPLQILPQSTPLVSEAIREAKTVSYRGIQTRVFRAEHLCAIALETGRAKDVLRVKMFLEQGAVEATQLRQIADRYNLGKRLDTVEADTDGGA